MLDNLIIQPDNVDLSKATQKWLYDYKKQENEKIFNLLFPVSNETEETGAWTEEEHTVRL